GTELNTESSDELNTALQVAIDRAANLNTFMRRYAEVVRVPVPVKQATKLGPVVERAARLIEPECHQRGILVVLDVDMDVPAQMVDVAQFEQVLTNVLRNAIEAVDQDGSIRLALVYDDGRVVFAVEDSGLGLSDEAQGKLFSPFFSTKPNGQGVGLMLVHEILTLHGLEFGIDSPEDGPTRFWIRFCE
ncbi:MAG: GHKL domain-containing protein, partial [bacterium]|nr:GHKL domain-containing protein [bacterium]